MERVRYNRMETKFIAAILLAFFLVSTVSAAPEQRPDMMPLLNSALTDMQRRVTFETGLINAMTTHFPSLSSLLNPRIAIMQTDESQLTEYANRGDAMNYSVYVQETFTQHLKQNADTFQAGLDSVTPDATGGSPSGAGSPPSGTGTGGTKNGGGGPPDGGSGTQEEKGSSPEEIKAAMEALQVEYKSLRDADDSCFDTEEYVELVLAYYNTTLNNYELRALNMTDRGINASNLLELVDNARTHTTTPLQDGFHEATNSSQFRILSNQYCLYDGCANGTNFHMAVKFETMRMTDVIAVMTPKATEAGLSSNVTAVQTSLNAAKTEIDSWGANAASPDQLKAVWTNIRSAAKASHDIFIALNNSAGTE